MDAASRAGYSVAVAAVSAVNVPDRLQLLFGPYRAPVFKYGDVVSCERAGQVELCGISSGRILSPLGRRLGEGYRPLRRHCPYCATRAGARCGHLLGVSAQTVSIWQKALAIGPTTTGIVFSVVAL